MAQRSRRPRDAPHPAAGPQPGLLTTLEAAALLHVHPKQVYRLFARGLPHRRVGSEWRYDREELLAWAGGGTPPGPATALSAVIASNGDLVVEVLLANAAAPTGPVLGATLADRETALALLRARRILAAGYHGTAFPAEVPEGRMARLHLVRREVGLVAAAGGTPRIADAARARMASRPPTAGVRAVLDEALTAAGLDPARVAKRALVCASHRDVVSAVARGAADLGIATRAWARLMGLSFRRLAEEDYGLLLFAEDLGRAEVVRLCETAQRPAFRSALVAGMGYDARESGRIHLDPAGAGAGTGRKGR